MTSLETLAPRERQIAEAVYRLEEASVNDVLTDIADPPSYNTVRAVLNTLVQKGFLQTRLDRGKYFYRPTVAKDTTQKRLVRNLVDNMFSGNVTDVVATLLDVAGDELSDSDYQRLRNLINDNKKRRQ